MRYKIDFSPQEILNPDTFEWVELTQEVIEKFDKHGYLNLQRGEGETKAVESMDGSTPMETEGHGDQTFKEEDADSDEEAFLFDGNMPGIPSIEEMNSVDLDHIAVRLKQGYCYAGNLFQWQSEKIENCGSAKAMVAEVVAAVGPEFISRLCLDFGRS